MANPSACPQSDLLQRFLEGQLGELQVGELERHLGRCAVCAETLSDAVQHDALLPALRAQATLAEGVDQAMIANLIARIKTVHHSAIHVPPAGTQAGGRSSQEVTAPSAETSHRDLVAFLSPAQSHDELGRLGSYRILKVLGAGGMGVVFLAEDIHLTRAVALKAMKPNAATTNVADQRFLREARIAASLKHDHVVTIYQVGEDHGVLFLAMELLDGESLHDRLEREGGAGQPLPLPEVLRIGREIADGLAAAHERGLVHRDIKPANIWLEGKRGRVKLLDFGLARPVQEEAHLTQSGAIVGTPQYMAPEQAQGEAVDARCDLFSLGCVLYRMSTGRLAFQAKDALATLLAVVHDRPARPCDVNPQLPAAFSDLVMQLLAKKPAERPASAHAVGDTLQQIERALPKPRPSGSGGRRRLPDGRGSLIRPRWWVAAALLLALVGGGFLAAPIIIRLKDKDGRETKIEVPDNTTVTIEKGGKVIAQVPATDQRPPLAGMSPLDQLAPAKIPAAERFDWQPKELVALLGENHNRHWGQLRSIVVSPDGKIAASCGNDDRTIRVWDVATGEMLGAPMDAGGTVNCLACCPDGTTLAAGMVGGKVVLCDLATRTPGTRFGIGYTNGVLALAYSPDGGTLYVGGFEGLVKVCDVKSRKVRAGWQAHSGEIWALALAPDGRTLATAAADSDGGKNAGIIKLWDPATGKERAALRGHTKLVKSLAFSPDSKTLLSGGEDLPCRLWDVATGQERAQLQSQTGYAVAFAPDGQSVALGGSAYHLGIWDVQTKRERVACQSAGWRSTALAFTPDGKTLISTKQNTVVFWDTATGKPRFPWRDRLHRINRVAFTADGKTLAAAGHGTAVTLWDTTTGAVRSTLGGPGESAADSVALSPDGRLVAMGSTYRLLRMWEVATGKEVLSNDVQEGHLCVAFSPDGRTLASGAEDGRVKLWDTATGKEQATLGPSKGRAFAVTFSPDGQTLAVGAGANNKGEMSLWDVVTRKRRASLVGDERGISYLAYAPDGRTLAAGNFSSTVVVWDVASGQKLRTLDPQAGWIYGVAFAPDGQTLATSGSGGRVVLWQAATGQKLHDWQLPGTVNDVAFAPDGRHLALGNGNGTVYILRLASAPK